MDLTSETIKTLLSLNPPNFHTAGSLEYSDKELTLVKPPQASSVDCSTLQGLVDLFNGELDDAKTKGDLLCHITSPTSVALISRESDNYGRRRMWATAKYPETQGFKFGAWLNPENFIISAQACFQRVKVEKDDGSFALDLDYVLKVASNITAEQASQNTDDGFAQRAVVRQGIALASETTLKPTVNLAPYRTFAEIDQVLSTFVFRASTDNGKVLLALFEGDGGRWKIGAYAALRAWLSQKLDKVPVIS